VSILQTVAHDSESKQEIVIIDDDLDYCNFVTEVLSSQYSCIPSNSGIDGIELFSKNDESIVVLVDLNLPDISGFEVCSQLSELRENRDFAIFVISGSDDTETKIKAFECGADDFISKPFEVNELLYRVKRSISYVEEKSRLKIENQNTQSMASIAMSQASQYSYVMNFFKSLNYCQDNNSIAKLFFDTMSLFGLNASLALRTDSNHYFDQQLSDISPIEKNIYEVLLEKGRLYEFGARLMVNGKRASFLVKNLPSDPNKAGEARDFLAAMIEGLDCKLADLEIKGGLVTAVNDLNQTIYSIKAGIQYQNKILSSVMGDMITEISSSYHALDLTEEQEQFFTELVEKNGQKMSGASELLNSIQSSLEGLKGKIELVQKATEGQIEHESESSGDDIELF
jgi:CheY-like chemotaxis protein